MSPPGKVRERILLPLVFLLLASLYFYRQILFGLCSYADDLFYLSFFDKAFFAEQIRSGVVPLWDPHIFSGTPHLANVDRATLYPPNLLFLLLSFPRAVTVYLLLHLWLAGTSVSLWCRRLGLSVAGACFAGFAYMLSGVFATENIHLGYYAAMAMAPLVFYLAETWLQQRNFRSAASLGLSMAFILLSGSPQFLVITGYCAVFYVVVRWREQKLDSGRTLFGDLRNLAFGVGLGLAAASIQVFPALEFIRFCRRPYPTGYAFATTFSSNIRELLAYPFSPAGHGWTGVLVLLFSFWALLTVRQKALRLLLFLSGLTALVSLGDQGWLFKIAYHLPGIALFRAPYRFILYGVLFLSAAAGFGFDSIFKKEGGTIPWIRFSGIFALLFFAGGWAASLFLGGQPVRVGFGLLWILCAALVVALVRKGGIPRRAGVVLLLLFLVLDVSQQGSIFGGIHPLTQPSFFHLDKERRWIEFLREHSARSRIYLPNTGEVRCLEYSTPGGKHFPFTPNFGERFGVENIDGYGQFQPSRYLTFMGEVPLPMALFLLNVEYFITSRDLSGVGGVELAFRDDPVKVYALKAAPRYFVLPAARAFNSSDEVIAAMQDPAFQPFSAVLLEGKKEEIEKPAGDFGIPSRVVVERETSLEVSVAVSSGHPGWLVSCTPFFPGWKAFVDGRPTAIYPAYAVFRAVHLPAGRHSVRFIYDPLSFRWGILVSLASLLLMLGLSRRERLVS